jgi:hypothetical protein
VVVALSLAAVGVQQVGAATVRASSFGSGTSIRVGRVHVDMRAVPAAPAVARPVHLAHLAPHSGSVAAAKANPTGAPHAAAPSRGPLIAGPTPTEELLTSFAGRSASGDISRFGSDQAVAPPDTQVAVGPTQVVEMVNSSIAVYDRSGVLLHDADNKLFFPMPTNPQSVRYSPTDPRVFYDAASGRWFASILGFDAANLTGFNAFTGSIVFIGVSDGSDATAGWSFVDGLGTGSSDGRLYDQPTLGVSDNLVVETANAFSNVKHNPPNYDGVPLGVVQKSDLIGTGSVRINAFVPNPAVFSVNPALSTTPTATQYLTYNNSDAALGLSPGKPTPAIGVLAITGTPAAGDLAITESDPLVTATSIPPNALQAGSATTISTGDDRIEQTLYRNGSLWSTATSGCIPLSDTTRSCAAIFQLAVSGSAASLTQQFFVSQSGTYLYYPALGVDASGNAYIVMTSSSSTTHAGVVVTGQLAGSPHGSTTPLVPVPAGAGLGVFDCGTGCGGAWGDYSGAAIDPATPTDVWVAGEYAHSASSTTDWGTALTRLTYAAPAISGISPNSGPTAGATAITVTGSDFVPGATTLKIGATPAGSVMVTSPTTITATTPAGPAGVAQVVATTGNGSNPSGPPATFLYVDAGQFHAVPPMRIADTRPGSGQPYAGQTVGNQGTLNVTVLGVGGVPATGVADVIFNLTAVGPTAPTFVTAYPAGLARPLASSLNVGTGQIIGNLVEVAVGSGGQVSFFNAAGSVDLVVDVQGYVSSTLSGTLGLFHPLPPARLFDTRSGSGQQNAGSTLSTGHPSITVQVDGSTTATPSGPAPTGVPSSGVSAVVINLTVTNATAGGYVTTWAADKSQPGTSSLNFGGGDTRGNRVIVPVSTTGTPGQISVAGAFSPAGSTDVIGDVVGWFTDGTGAGTGSLFSGVSPGRLCDTRAGSGTQCSGHTLGAAGPSSETINVAIAGHVGVPAMSASKPPTAVVMNMTVTGPSLPSYLIGYPGPAGTTAPLASDLNFGAGETRGNLVVVKLGPDGTINVFNSMGMDDVVLDVVGFYA